jgi:hypothetical protein
LAVAEAPKSRETTGVCATTNSPPVGTIVNFDSSFLFASLLWGSVGIGYWVYGKRQRAMSPMLGGVAMIGISYLVSSWLLMSLLCIAIGAGVYALLKRGD